MKFSKTQLSKIIQSGGVFIRDIPIFGNISPSVAKKGTDTARSLGIYFLDNHIDKFMKQVNL